MRFSLCAPTVRRLRSAVGGGERIRPAIDNSPVGESPFAPFCPLRRTERLYSIGTRNAHFFSKLLSKKTSPVSKKRRGFSTQSREFYRTTRRVFKSKNEV